MSIPFLSSDGHSHDYSILTNTHTSRENINIQLHPVIFCTLLYGEYACVLCFQQIALANERLVVVFPYNSLEFDVFRLLENWFSRKNSRIYSRICARSRNICIHVVKYSVSYSTNNF